MAILRNITAIALLAQFILLVMPTTSSSAERIKDIADVEGVRGNALVGYGLVVGLNRTGDNAITSPFSVYTVLSMLEKLGIRLRDKIVIASTLPRNVAAVMVTAELPPFARPGQKLDVTVSSLGNATSLRGGTLLVTPLLGGDNQIYAMAQGSISIGGFTASGKGASLVKNHPTAGRIPNGADIEKAAPHGLKNDQDQVILNLRQADFTTAKRMTDAINAHFGDGMAHALSAGSVVVENPTSNAVSLIAELEGIELITDHPAIVVMDERTGTIVMGSEVRIDTVAVAHGNISVSITEVPQVSQPNAFAGGTTTTVARTDLQVTQQKARLVVLPKQVSLARLVTALNAVGATPNDLIAVLQAIQAAGALHAKLKMI